MEMLLMNATGFCEKYGYKYNSRIKSWYEKGYLGNTKQDEKTLEYDIPDDIPLPYCADPRVSTLPTLLRDILDAAAHCCSIFASMYPKIPNGTYDRTEQDFVDQQMIRICYTESGDKYIELCSAGWKFMTEIDSQEREKKLKKVTRLISSGMSFVQAFASVWPLI